jgi:hypothetical protein
MPHRSALVTALLTILQRPSVLRPTCTMCMLCFPFADLCSIFLGCACSVLYLVVFVVILLYFLTVTFVGVFLYEYSRFFMVIRFVRSCMHVLFVSIFTAGVSLRFQHSRIF